MFVGGWGGGTYSFLNQLQTDWTPPQYILDDSNFNFNFMYVCWEGGGGGVGGGGWGRLFVFVCGQILSNCRLTELLYTIYWTILISGMSGYVI